MCECTTEDKLRETCIFIAQLLKNIPLDPKDSLEKLIKKYLTNPSALQTITITLSNSLKFDVENYICELVYNEILNFYPSDLLK